MYRKELIAKLESLVHNRYSKAELTKMVNDVFGVSNIEIDWHGYEDVPVLTDFNAMFTTYENEKVAKNLRGDFDIYYLECKQPNQFGKEVYVTEVGYEFKYRH
jgi:hypothetical protein